LIGRSELRKAKLSQRGKDYALKTAPITGGGFSIRKEKKGVGVLFRKDKGFMFLDRSRKGRKHVVEGKRGQNLPNIFEAGEKKEECSGILLLRRGYTGRKEGALVLRATENRTNYGKCIQGKEKESSRDSEPKGGGGDMNGQTGRKDRFS